MPEFVSQREFDIWKKEISEMLVLHGEVLDDFEERIGETDNGFDPRFDEVREEISVYREHYQKVVERLTGFQKRYMALKEKRQWKFRGKQGDEAIRFTSFEYVDADKPWIDMPLKNVRYLMTKDPEATINLDDIDKTVDGGGVPVDLVNAIEDGGIVGIDKLRLVLGLEDEDNGKKGKEEVVGETLDKTDDEILSHLEKVGKTKTGEVRKTLRLEQLVFANKVEKLKRMGRIREVEVDKVKYLELVDENLGGV